MQQIERTLAPVSIEDRRDALNARDADLNRDRKAMALEAWQLRLAWGLLYPRSSTREYIAWLGHGEVHNRWYGLLDAGLAIEKGLDAPHLRIGDLKALGERLKAGETLEQVQAQPASKPAKTSVKLSKETAEQFDALFAELSEGGQPLTREQALETTVQAFAQAPAVIRRALVSASETGENPLDALVKAVDERRDWRGWLAKQGCCVCGVHPVELHHIRVSANDRYRTNDVLMPTCTRHHIARPGDDEDAAHTGQNQWIERHFGSQENFWTQVALLYVRYAQESEQG